MMMNLRIPDELNSLRNSRSMDLKEEKIVLIRAIYMLIKDLVQKFRNKDKYCFNIALPTWGEGFRMILQFAEDVLVDTKNKTEVFYVRDMIR
jgi:hypothetical protein